MLILQLMNMLVHLTSTIQAILPVRLNSRFLQQQQIQAVEEEKSYLEKITFNSNSKQELLWWIKLYKAKGLSLAKLQIGLEKVVCLLWLMESLSISMPRELCFRVFKLIILS